MPFRLSDLPKDVLEKVFEVVRIKYPLKSTCRAMRQAHPEGTRTPHWFVFQSLSNFEWARSVGYECNDSMAPNRAARFGKDDILHWLVKILGVEWSHYDVFENACRGGCMDVLEFLEAEAQTNENLRYKMWAYDDEASAFCAAAAEAGHVHVIEWLRVRGHRIGERTARAAARGGSVAALQHVFGQVDENLPEWLARTCEGGHTACAAWLLARGAKVSRFAGFTAAIHGHLDLLKFLASKVPQLRTHVTRGAVHNDHLECVKFCFEADAEDADPYLAAEQACYHDSPKVLRWLLEEKRVTTVPSSALLLAIDRGRMRALQVLQEFGQIPTDDPELCERAVECGSLEALKFLRAHGCVWTEGHELNDGVRAGIATVALKGHENEIFRWLVEAGACPPNQQIMNVAMSYGNLQCLSWLMRQAPYDWEELRACGKHNDKLRVTSFIERGDHHVYEGWPAPWEEEPTYNCGIIHGEPDSS
jgi:hypothetical protein